MKKLGLVLMCLVLVCGFAFAEGSKEAATAVPKIGVAVPSPDHGWTGGIGWWADKAVKDIEAENPGKYEFKVLHADGYAKQISDVEDLMVWGMDYLVILPHESAQLTPIVKEAYDSGVQVVVVDRNVTEQFPQIYVAGDNNALGRVSGEYMAKFMVDNGLTNYVAMGGLPIPIDTMRMTNFFAAMNEEPSLVNLSGGDKYDFADWSTQKGLELMETYLQKYPKIDAVYCQDDDVLTGVVQAIAESGRDDVKLVLGGAGSKAVFEKIMNDDPLVHATATYPPRMIRDGILECLKLVDSGETLTEYKTVVIPSEIVDKSNVADWYEPGSVY